MKYRSFMLSAAALCLLSACSSSSGGGGQIAPTFLKERPNTDEPYNTTLINAPGKNGADNGASYPADSQAKLAGLRFSRPQDARLTGALVAINHKDGTVAANRLNHVEKESLETLLINGTEIALKSLAAEDEQRGFNPITTAHQQKGSLGEISGAVNKSSIYSLYNPMVYQFVRFGVVNSATHSHLFVQGLQTPLQGIWGETENGHADLFPMPTSGKVVYKKGDALYGKEGNYTSLNAEVKADFSEKRLEVSLKNADKTEKLNFSATIDGNTFSGNTQRVESQGAFYGSRANQVGGVFYETQSGYHGVFGATDKVAGN